MKENYNLDDGAYIAVKIIIEAVRRRKAGGGGISDLLSELKEPLEEAEVRLKISADDFKSKGAEVLEVGGKAFTLETPFIFFSFFEPRGNTPFHSE